MEFSLEKIAFFFRKNDIICPLHFHCTAQWTVSVGNWTELPTVAGSSVCIITQWTTPLFSVVHWTSCWTAHWAVLWEDLWSGLRNEHLKKLLTTLAIERHTVTGSSVNSVLLHCPLLWAVYRSALPSSPLNFQLHCPLGSTMGRTDHWTQWTANRHLQLPTTLATELCSAGVVQWAPQPTNLPTTQLLYCPVGNVAGRSVGRAAYCSWQFCGQCTWTLPALNRVIWNR